MRHVKVMAPTDSAKTVPQTPLPNIESRAVQRLPGGGDDSAPGEVTKTASSGDRTS